MVLVNKVFNKRGNGNISILSHNKLYWIIIRNNDIKNLHCFPLEHGVQKKLWGSIGKIELLNWVRENIKINITIDTLFSSIKSTKDPRYQRNKLIISFMILWKEIMSSK